MGRFGREKKEKVMYFICYRRKKCIYSILLNIAFSLTKSIHTFVWSFQLESLMYVMLHLFFSTCSGQRRQVRSVTWKSFTKDQSCFQYLPLYLCNFYFVVLKLLGQNLSHQKLGYIMSPVDRPSHGGILWKEIQTGTS